MARLSPEFLSDLRDRIEVIETLKALQECVDGKRKLTKEQVKAAEILLRKAMPDLKAIEVTGKDGGPIAMTVSRIELVDLDDGSPGKASA